MVRPPNTTSTQLAQTGNVFSKFAPMMPLGFIQAVPQGQEQMIFPSESPIETIDYTNAINSRAVCLGTGGLDSDMDGLPDTCEREHFPYTYNGWIVGGRYFDSKDQRLTLNAAENAEWNRDVAERGGVGFGNISAHAQRLVKKFSALKKLSDSDVPALREIYYSYSQEPIRISDDYRSYVRSNSFQANEFDDRNLGLAAGDGDETIPYNVNRPATNVAGLTAFGKDTDSYREQGRFKMIVYETNVVIPKNTDSLQVTIGHLSNDRFMMPPRTGMYYVINNGDSVLLQNQLLNDKGHDFQGSRFGLLKRNTGCSTAHLIVVYITDGSNDRRGQPILPEVVAFRASEKEAWTTLSQEYFTVQPQGGIECQQTFGVNDTRNSRTFFKPASQITRHVPGVIDFNTSLGNIGIANPYKMLDASSTSLELIRAAATDKPVETMTAFEAYEYEKALEQIEQSALTADDKAWVIDQLKKAEDRQIALDPAKAGVAQLEQLQKLNTELASLDSSSPDFEAKAKEIQQLIDALDKNPTLSDDQRKILTDQTNAFNTKKSDAGSGSGSGSGEKTLAPKVVQFDSAGTIDVTPAALSALAPLGFEIKDEKGNAVDSKSMGKGGKISPETADAILKHFQDKIDAGELSANEAAAMKMVLDDLKKNPSMKDKVAAFEAKNNPKIDAALAKGPKQVDLASNGSVTLSPEEVKLLKDLGFTFVDETKKPIDAAAAENKKISPDEVNEILEQLGKQLESGQMTPEERAAAQKLLNSLKNNKGVDPTAINNFEKKYDKELRGLAPVGENPKQVDLAKVGPVTLSPEDVQNLKDLGFTFADEKGKSVDPSAAANKKISPDEVDQILEQIGKQLDSDQLTPEQKLAASELLESLKKNKGVDAAKIDQFIDDHADKLATEWTPEQLAYLTSLDADSSKVKPNLGSQLAKWKNGFKTPAEEAVARDAALSAIEKKLTDPTTLANYPVAERLKDAETLNVSGLISPTRYAALLMNIALFGSSGSSGFQYKPAKTSIGTDAQGNEIIRDLIKLEGATIRFKLGSNEIEFASQQLLQRIAKEIKNYKTFKKTDNVYVLLKAYTDPSGGAATNQKLSECRANAVKDFFMGESSIALCNGKGVITGKKFTVDSAANIEETHRLLETSIKAMGMGIDLSQGKKVTKQAAEKLRRVEIYLSDNPF